VGKWVWENGYGKAGMVKWLLAGLSSFSPYLRSMKSSFFSSDYFFQE
jgi:hypothetical protein